MSPSWALRVIAGVGVVAASLAATPAQAASPTVVLVGPAPESHGVAAGDRLRVRVADADGDPLTVRFHLRRDRGRPNDAEPFTWLAIPDTQNYLTPAYQANYGTQMRWIVDHAADLNLALATHLGDVVGTWNRRSEFETASGYQRILDDAGIPNTVLPGNHDLDVSTGAADLYREYFPVARYAGAPWNSAAVRYGGFYGQDQFGDDPDDRQNMDSYVLLTRAGIDFLVLNLEFNPPDDVLAWAGRVIDAHPGRRVMVATHNMIGTDGSWSHSVARPGGNYPEAVWSKLIAPHCSIFMVINGHNHDGLEGEANRTLTNDCGQPVQLALSDYQQRPNGGDGLLRYYTFSPATNTIAAYTWSATRQQFETDANSRFDLPYDLSLPGDDTTVGAPVVAASGTTAEVVLPELDDGVPYTWYAEVTDGTTTVRSDAASFVAGTADDGVVLRDAFERTATNGWGRADTGQAWTVSTPTASSVTGGRGVLSIAAGAGPRAMAGTPATTDVDLTTSMALDRRPAGSSLYAAVMPRWVGGSDHYRNRVVVGTDGSVSAEVSRVVGGVETVLARTKVAGLTVDAGTRVRVRARAEGTAPTTLRTKVWREGDPEPGAWTATATDSTPGLQRAAGLGLWAYLSRSATNAPVAVSFDDVVVAQPGTPTPVNQPPSAAFTLSAADLVASVDASGSADPDGTVTSYAWSWGDGTPGSTGRTASHTFAGAGTYTVGLTVTDDDGATASTTRAVTVTAPPPPAGVLARDDFGRTSSTGWGSADVGGPWTVVGGAAAFAVAGGAGTISLAAGASRTAWLAQPAQTAADTTVRIGFDKVATGSGTYAALIGRAISATSGYRARLVIASNGQVRLDVSRMVSGTETLLGSAYLPGVQHTAQRSYRIRFVVNGVAPTTLRAWAWPDGGVASTAPTLQATDATTALQSAGGVGVWGYVSSGATNGPHVVSVDELRTTTP